MLNNDQIEEKNIDKSVDDNENLTSEKKKETAVPDQPEKQEDELSVQDDEKKEIVQEECVKPDTENTTESKEDSKPDLIENKTEQLPAQEEQEEEPKEEPEITSEPEPSQEPDENSVPEPATELTEQISDQKMPEGKTPEESGQEAPESQETQEEIEAQPDADTPEAQDSEEESTPEQKPEEEHSDKKQKEKEIALYEKTLFKYERGQIVKGTIVSINDKEVLVDIGYKSEGAIPISEFATTSIPELNSEINVYIEAVEDGEGKLKLSKKEADFNIALKDLKVIFDNKESVKGILKRRVKGGMMAEIKGIEAFLPGSHISIKPIPNLDQFIGKEFDFKIINLDIERRNIIVSRKIVLESELEDKKESLKEKIKIDSELDGEVKNITDYGAFIDLGGIDGLLHITDMSWGHLNHPSEMLNIGDKLKVKVIDFDEENERVSLGLKQLVPHPWENIEAKYEEGTKVTGKVVNITSYGAFVELEPGVEGLVHVTELSWTKKITHPNQLLKVGDTVDAIVLSVSKEEKRISLGIKQMYPNPWLTIDDRYPTGKVFKTKVKNITPFGVFVEIEDDIDGLVHISDISWTKRIYHPREVYRKGQELEVIVLSVDKPLHRISLGVKQLSADPWENINENLPVNTEVNGVISKLIPKGVLVDIKSGDSVVEGFVPVSHLSIPKIDTPDLYFDIGEELPLKVIELDVENRRLILSVKAYFFSREKEYLVDYQKNHEEKAKQKKLKKEEKKKS